MPAFFHTRQETYWSIAEHRCIYFAKSPEEGALEQSEKRREEAEKELPDTLEKATDRIKAMNLQHSWEDSEKTKWWITKWLGNRWTGATERQLAFHKEAIAAEIEGMAQAQLQSMEKANADLHAIAEKVKPCIALLRCKQKICKEILSDLDKDIEQKKALAEEYEAMAKLLGTNYLTKNDLRIKRGYTREILGDVERELKATPEGRRAEHVEKIDTRLRSILALAGVSIDIDAKLTDILTAPKADRMQKIDDLLAELSLQKMNQVFLDQCRDAIEQVTGMRPGVRPGDSSGLMQEQSAGVSANYYLEKEAERKNALDKLHESTDNKDRLQALLQAPIGQEVALQRGGKGTNIFYKNGVNNGCVTLHSSTLNLAINTATGGCASKLNAVGKNPINIFTLMPPIKLDEAARMAHKRAIYLNF